MFFNYHQGILTATSIKYANLLKHIHKLTPSYILNTYIDNHRVIHLCMSISRPLLCVRVCVTGVRHCVPPVPTRRPSSLQEPALWYVCGMWRSTRTKSLTWNSDRLVCVQHRFNSNIRNVFAPMYWPSFSSQPLYGHTDSVTCLAVSEVHSMIVSGSRDLTCILWDMEELSYITQLAGHTTSISALAINELTVSSLFQSPSL